MRTALKEMMQSREVEIWLATAEEDRSLSIVQDAAEQAGRVVFEWDCVNAFTCRSARDVRLPGNEGSRSLDDALSAVETYNLEPSVFVFRDFDLIWERMRGLPEIVPLVRRLRRLATRLKAGKNTIVFLSGSASVPPEIEPCVALVRAPLPTVDELIAIYKGWSTANGLEERCNLDEDSLYRLGAAAAGMTSIQAQSALARSLVRRKEIGPMAIPDMVEAKTEVLKKTGLLELIQTPESFESIGGLDALKTWLQKRSQAYSKAASVYGLPRPKGVLLVGVPGTGKSLTAKAVANLWGMPQVRLDVGRLYGSLVGETEERLRRALEIIEGVAPCVAWIDEIEKAFGGATGPSGDSGVSQRVFGNTLTWLQERKASVFVVATANNIHGLPPEFLRRGRFDEIFFIDLPKPCERRAILDVLLRKYNREPSGLVSDDLIAKLDRFTGAEIEQVIIEALYNAFYDSQREIVTDDLRGAAVSVLPIADQMRTQIEALRLWGRAQARLASSEKEN